MSAPTTLPTPAPALTPAALALRRKYTAGAISSARVEDCPATLGKMVVIGCAICMPTLAVICFICNYKQIRAADVSINQSTSDAGTPRVSPPWEEQHPIMPGDPHYQGVPKSGVGTGSLKPSPPPMARGRELSAHESARVRHQPHH